MRSGFKRLSGLALFAGCAVSAHASITWNFNTLTPVPSSDETTWATLTIGNIGTDQVKLTLTPGDSPKGPWFVGDLWLNLSEIPFDLSADFSDPISSITWKEDGIPNAGNFWDVNVDFFTSKANRLEAGETVTWTMSGTGLDESDFLAISTAKGSNVASFGMLHLQGFNRGPTSRIMIAPVPEPASLAALGLGALVILRRRRR